MSISPTFLEQLLRALIPKVQKIQSSHQCLFALLGSAQVKGLHKNVGKIDPLMTSIVVKIVTPSKFHNT